MSLVPLESNTVSTMVSKKLSDQRASAHTQIRAPQYVVF